MKIGLKNDLIIFVLKRLLKIYPKPVIESVDLKFFLEKQDAIINKNPDFRVNT